METHQLPISVQKEIAKVSEIAQYLWQREWAERNAGNISINLSEHFSESDFDYLTSYVSCRQLPAEAANQTYFITGTGCYLRSLINKIEEASCIIHINGSASGYAIVWGGKSKPFAPTSELISHIKIHCFNQKYKPTYKAVLHTHTIELIVLSHHPIFYDEAKFNHSLWKLCPEIRVFVPNGVHCCPYALSGTEALADITIEGLKNHDVILWEKHGALATGEDVVRAFDFLDVANKGAKMLLMAWAAGFEPQGMSDEQLNELEVNFLGK